MLSGVSTGFMGSKYTRLLKHGEAGHTVAIVELSWIESPWGSSSRCITFRTPPVFGVCADRPAGPITAITTASAVTRDHRALIEPPGTARVPRRHRPAPPRPSYPEGSVLTPLT